MVEAATVATAAAVAAEAMAAAAGEPILRIEVAECTTLIHQEVVEDTIHLMQQRCRQLITEEGEQLDRVQPHPENTTTKRITMIFKK